MIQTHAGCIKALTYVPGHRLITVTWASSDLTHGEVKAVSVDRKKTVWKTTGKVASSLVYCGSLDVLFAATADRIAAFDARDGSKKDIVLPAPEALGQIEDLGLHGNQLVVVSSGSDSVRVSYFELSAVH